MLRYILGRRPRPRRAGRDSLPAPARVLARPSTTDIVLSVPLAFIIGGAIMSFSHQISVTEHRARLDCGTLSQVDELNPALDRLVGEADFQRSFGLLVELGQDGPILECTHALAVADAFGSRRNQLQGRVALYAPGERGRISALFIAMIGRHQGLRMEAFRERAWAVQWLGGPVRQPA